MNKILHVFITGMIKNVIFARRSLCSWGNIYLNVAYTDCGKQFCKLLQEPIMAK